MSLEPMLSQQAELPNVRHWPITTEESAELVHYAEQMADHYRQLCQMLATERIRTRQLLERLRVSTDILAGVVEWPRTASQVLRNRALISAIDAAHPPTGEPT